MAYNKPTISNYNDDAPADDGSQVASNQIKWLTVKNEIGDPLKTYIDAVNDATESGFQQLFAGNTETKSATFNVSETNDGGKFFNCTNAITANLPAAADAGDGFNCIVFNNSSGTISIDGNSSETINGSTTVSLTSQYSAYILICNGTSWYGLLINSDSNAEATLASATTTDLGSVTSNVISITGTTTITGFGSSANTNDPIYFVRFTGSLTLTHNGTSLIIPGGENITTSAGDMAVVQYLGSGNWRLRDYQYAQGTNITMPVLQGYIYGLNLSNDTDTDHDINISAGMATDSTNAQYLTLSSAMVKRFDASWASGTGNGGLSSSLTPANNTWYHVFLILVGGSIDVGFDTSITAANLVSDHSATAYRRIGSVMTDGSANIRNFVHNGDEFYWDTPYLDHSATGSTTAASIVLSTPLGVKTKAFMNLTASSNAVYAYVSSLDNTDQAPSTTASPLFTTGSASGASPDGYGEVWTNTSSQVRLRSSGTGATIYITTLGYKDPR